MTHDSLVRCEDWVALEMVLESKSGPLRRPIREPRRGGSETGASPHTGVAPPVEEHPDRTGLVKHLHASAAPTRQRHHVRSLVDLGLLGFLVALSSLLIFRYGKLGFHFHDLSIVFDGGYRVFSGQLPFRDFVAPIGPVIFVQQALLFKLFGVSLNSYLLHAALLNGAAVALAFALFRKLDRPAAFFAAAVTAFWFFLPPGAPYIDTTALLWSFVGLYLCYTALQGDPSDSGLLAASGASIGLALLTKQNAGSLALLATAILLVSSGRQQLRRAALFAVGLGALLALYVVYLLVVDGSSAFAYFGIRVPLGAGRLGLLLPRFLWPVSNLLKGRPVWSVDTSGWLRDLLLYGLGMILVGLAYRDRETPKRHLALLIGLMVWVEYTSFATSSNDWQLYLVFIGIIVAGIVLIVIDERRVRLAIYAVLLIPLAGLGWKVSATREVHGIDVSAQTYVSKTPEFSGLRLTPEEGEAMD